MYVYGDRRDYGKIDIYVSGRYKCTTTWAGSLTEAKARYLEANPEVVPEVVDVQYADNETGKGDIRRRIRLWI